MSARSRSCLDHLRAWSVASLSEVMGGTARPRFLGARRRPPVGVEYRCVLQDRKKMWPSRPVWNATCQGAHGT